ncbi:MAG: SDR family NAD(P)-dependent oxidoreductase [Pseudomonadota bacterium]
MSFTDITKPGQVALVTGAASGIGRAACRHFAASGMAVAMVDLEGDALPDAAAEVTEVHPEAAIEVQAFACDLSSADAMDALHQDVVDRFGKVNLLMNNAVTRIGRGHDVGLDEWREAMEVNFWAVVNAVRAFLPGMQASDEPGVIVNVGSKQGITNPPGHPIYNITKSALKTYTEGLEHELRSSPGRKVRAHFLIPGWTTTGSKAHQQGAWLPEQVIEFMVDGLQHGDFYILCPDDEVSTAQDHRRILWGASDITENRPPLSRWHAAFADEAKKHC